MKKLLMVFCVVAIAFNSLAQSNLNLPLILKNDDGSTDTYIIQKGDKLVYEVKAGGSTYDFIITVNSEGIQTGIDFNYEMTNATKTSGHVKISAHAKRNASKYVNYFKGGELSLTDACTVWLSGKNFSDMPDRKTVMQIDNNAPETFYRPVNDEVEPVVKIKGKDQKIDGFKINNAPDGTGGKTIWINNDSSNALILKMELGFSIVLKEIK